MSCRAVSPGSSAQLPAIERLAGKLQLLANPCLLDFHAHIKSTSTRKSRKKRICGIEKCRNKFSDRIRSFLDSTSWTVFWRKRKKLDRADIRRTTSFSYRVTFLKYRWQSPGFPATIWMSLWKAASLLSPESGITRAQTGFFFIAVLRRGNFVEVSYLRRTWKSQVFALRMAFCMLIYIGKRQSR